MRGVYKRTKPAWNKGIPCSDATKKKLSIKIKGRKAPWMLGNKYSKAQIGQKRPGVGGVKKGNIPWNKGMIGFNVGEKNGKWVADRTKLQKYGNDNQDRRSSAYRDWRNQVWIRDGYKCRIENQDCAGRIEAHHILGYKDYPELRYIANNGITLCHHHHPRKKQDELRLSPYFQSLVAHTEQ